jgi:hypothetical protein
MDGQRSWWRRVCAAGLLAALIAPLMTIVTSGPSAAGPGPRAGVGFEDASVNGWGGTDSMQGSFRLTTDDGRTVFGYCVDHGLQYPQSVVAFVGDTIGAGPGDAEHDALAYLLARYGDTDDPVTAAALAIVAHYVARDGLFAPGQQLADVVIGPDDDWGGNDWAVYDRVQSLWAEGLAKRGPWTLSVVVTPQPYTTSVGAVATLSGPGGPISGELVFASATGATVPAGAGHLGSHVSDAAGRVWLPLQDPSGTVAANVASFSAPTTINVYRGGAGTQPVAVGDVPWGSTGASASVDRADAVVRVRKQSTSSYLSTAGATFEVWADADDDEVIGFASPDALVATLTTGPTGDTPTATSAYPGRLHAVREITAPAGHTPAGPWYFTPQPGETVTVTAPNNEIADGRLAIRKIDADTGEALSGGLFRVDLDADGDGSFETHIGDHPAGSVLSSLRAGRYQVTELLPPAGYTLPEVRTQILTVSWNNAPVAEFVFADHQPVVTTEASLTHTAAGAPFTDTVTLGGVAAATTGTLTVTLFGPYAFDETPVCAADDAQGMRTMTTAGSGVFTAGPFVASVAGVYTFVASWTGDDGSSATHACGLATETVRVQPGITTRASDQEVAFGFAIHDEVVVADVPDGYAGQVTVALYGPYADATAVDCASRDLVWSSEFAVTGSGTFASPEVSPIASGLYTFVATWSSPGATVHVTHACGEAAETVRVHPRLDTATSRSSLALGEDVHDVVELTGVPAGWAGTVTLELFGPFPHREAVACEASTSLASWRFDIRGAGTFPSASWTPREKPDAGWYTWLARYDGEDGSVAAHDCGDERETFVVHLPPAALEGDKRTTQHPEEPVRGARYHVYVSSSDLPALGTRCDAAYPANATPSGCDGAPPSVEPRPLAGHHFLAEVITGDDGRFRAAVWRDVGFCVREVAAPDGWRLDDVVHCTRTDDPVASLALVNERLTTTVAARKFDRAEPTTPVAGAGYVLYVVIDDSATAPPLADPWFRDAPAGAPGLRGARPFALGVTDTDGAMSFTGPAGHRWCVLEVQVPAGWRRETEPACTDGTVHEGDGATLLLAEDRLPPRLAFSGTRGPDVVIGLLAVCSGWLLRRGARWWSARTDCAGSTC